ncbi:MAG TPA: hypothetical protein VN017_02325 [Pseudoxanthomonas sp.]|uniref:EF-hand domain-containing protein n=1 Tax=Pseudoxanthomonas helianthi TaxID=1453541 RepID=A0A940X4M4_9GAMM|nr:hypothetical protein [Pseudoxanthomonas helianthi]MBP3985296.1 hypothetical protein [Pseudoxanthomonas helianthi]HWU70177.1 hypothetical protein [Pseudoxanthomonas sp.]
MSARAVPFALIASLPMCCAPWIAMAGQAASPAPKTDGSSKVFAALDANRDGNLSQEEFRKGYPGLRQAIALEVRLREQFQSIDADRSGALEAGEYANLALVKQAGQAAPGLPAFDADKDGRLEFDEYVAAVRALFALGQKTRGSAPAAAGEGQERR